MDGGDEVFWKPGTSNTFTKVGLLPDTEHTFRVRTIHEKMIGDWSNAEVKEDPETPSTLQCQGQE